MVGVFDPKTQSSRGGINLKHPVSIGAVAALVGCIGLVSANFLVRPAATDTAELTSAPLASMVDEQISTEAPIILTSFQDLQPIAEPSVRRETLQSKDTLTALLDRLGIERSEANAALYALYDQELIDPRKVRPGLELAAYVEPSPSADNAEAVRLIGLSLKNATESSLVVSRTMEGGFTARELHTRLEPQLRRVSGSVDTSFYQAALDAGAKDAHVYDFAQIFAYDVDFQREMRQGDEFEMVFEVYTDERGQYVRTGDVLYASLDGHAADRRFYRFTPEDDGVTDYFDQDGKSARKFLMKTPINGARLSSNFGYRRHPILGYNKLHTGTDFAAPSGTPIYAAGNGVIERASWFGGYGNYVKIQHPNGYETAYAHMLRYGPGIKSGVRVKQGQVIGYVGTTGRSTGPHLHYEVAKDGKRVNPMGLKLPTGRTLEGKALEDFNRVRAEIDAVKEEQETAPYASYVSLDSEIELAKADISLTK